MKSARKFRTSFIYPYLSLAKIHVGADEVRPQISDRFHLLLTFVGENQVVGTDDRKLTPIEIGAQKMRQRLWAKARSMDLVNLICCKEEFQTHSCHWL
ncbi:MAG: hypothetical protein NZ937_08560 [Armatimonadetes bacterium]|nr:hypothetical protein [Armatimonadota bacterium]